MFAKRQMEKYCDVLLWALKTARKGDFKKKDVVMIRYDLAGIKMAEILPGSPRRERRDSGLTILRFIGIS